MTRPTKYTLYDLTRPSTVSVLYAHPGENPRQTLERFNELTRFQYMRTGHTYFLSPDGASNILGLIRDYGPLMFKWDAPPVPKASLIAVESI